MKTIRHMHRISQGLASFTCAWLLAASSSHAEPAKVAPKTIEVAPDAAKKSLIVGFRLVDAMKVTSVTVAAEGIKEPLPATWEAWDGTAAKKCAWLIVVDTSNPARAKTIEACKEAVRAFVTRMPKSDTVAIYGLARDLDQVVPFGSSKEDALAAVTPMKAYGDAAQTTLIYQNLREGLGKLKSREEPRKAVLLITDGKDETPGGAAAQEIEKNKLIESAKAAGIVVHTLGYAENLDDQRYFGALREISTSTDGLFFPATVVGKELPKGAMPLLHGVMQGCGAVHVDLASLEKPVAITLKAVTSVSVGGESGVEAIIKLPVEEVAKAFPATDAATPEEAKKLEEEKKQKAEAEAKAKADEEKKASDEKAAAEAATQGKEKAATDAKEKEKQEQVRLWSIVGGSLLLVLILVAVFMVRASRKRAAEFAEQARMEEEARLAEEARIAMEHRRVADETRKAPNQPLAWIEMCDAEQKRHPISIPSLKIGRGQHNDLVLKNDSVSGNHCVLNRSREGFWTITDLNSGNGVMLNGHQVQQAELRHGDTIELGDLRMRFLLNA